ncbi:hypothetical protein GCM10010528_25830 [Gordonia defluvii]|jgi:hypothetical protein|uniref:Hemophore-related protein n=1 Tax=Gordonia defluvii TaxID=283718 RepID=A0ABP6LJU6_9ACTN|nr:hypothetical protein [Gordonia sp. UBA5067]
MSALRRTVATAIAGAGAVWILPAGVGHAAPMPVHGPAAKPIPATTPVPGTACTYGQTEKALAGNDPQVWAKITEDAHYRGHFQEGIMLTAKQRKAKDDEWRKAHPAETVGLEAAEAVGVFGTPGEAAKGRARFGAALDKARATCASF